MHFLKNFGLVAFFALAHAAPAPHQCRNPSCVIPPTLAPTPSSGVVIFNGAAGAQYFLTVILDGKPVPTNNRLSISTISSNTINVASQRILKTVDYPPALVEGPLHTWAVGPPQTVISIGCTPGGSPPQPPVPTYIAIEFNGADPGQGAKYSVSVPLDGSLIYTHNALSISTLVSTFVELPTKCYFDYVDYQAALVLVRPNTWAVGPPQTIKSVSCHA
ncbi:hypothetical protein B0O99DRAFT_650279 [Bisporella sp. PMI_857]|nr:hypothetical protein B0O99DRAFT_650279 [Bisporella sp. PMI_857]